MDESPRPIAVVGPGAIGSFLAWRLSRSGRRVILVGRSRSWQRGFTRFGLSVKDPSAPRPKASGMMTPVTLPPRKILCDCVIFCVKSMDSIDAARKARALIGPDTAVLGLQNGLSHAVMLRKTFGPSRTVLGAAYIAVERLSPLEIVFHGGQGIHLGIDEDNRLSVQRLKRALQSAGIKVAAIPSRDRLLWTKLIFNAAINPIASLSNRSNADAVRIPALRELLSLAAEEGRKVSSALGIEPLFPDMASEAFLRCGKTGSQTNSMLQDLRAGRPTEIRAILGPILSAARKKRIPTPLLASLYGLVNRLEKELLQ